MENKNYAAELVADGVYAIDDVNGESMYLLNGGSHSLLIDTGMMKGSILPVIAECGARDTELLLTHAHIDHMYHADEFDSVYIYGKEKEAWDKGLRSFVRISAIGMLKKMKTYHVNVYHALTEDSVIDLGDRQLKVIEASGHTPGSCIYADEHDKLLFTGDAVGSGDGAWMWMPGCSDISDYMESLEEMIRKIRPYEDFRFLGGHRMQGVKSSDHPDADTLCLGTFDDMHVLCTKMLSGEVQPKDSKLLFGIRVCLYSYGKASMWVRKKQIK